MSSYINVALRQLVATRAEYLCEYCLIHEEDAFFGCEVDHIISEKHGGQTEADFEAMRQAARGADPMFYQKLADARRHKQSLHP